MTNNAPVYWELLQADNTWFSLHTYAWSVKSFGGRRWIGGAKRGENLQLPHRRGRIYVPKQRESQDFDLNMWVFPTNNDGSKDPTKTTEQKAHENFRKLFAAFDQDGQFLLRKRWYRDNGTVATQNTAIDSAIARAEFIDGSGPDSDDGAGFYCNMSLVLADPFFYSNQIVPGGLTAATKAGTAVTLNNNATTTLDGGTIKGEVKTDHVWLSLSNMASSNPRINFPDGNWIQLMSAYMDDKNSNVVIDCQTGLVVQSTLEGVLLGSPTSNKYYSGLVRRNPYFQSWPTLDPNRPGGAAITTAGSGTMKWLYDPAYR